jgi:hypothetical protein
MKKNVFQISSVLLVCTLLMIIGSCSKYENGGIIKKAEKHLTTPTWKLTNYLRNGIDETSSLHISNLTEHYMSDGILHRNYVDQNGDNQQQTGTWELIDDNSNLKIDGIGSIDLSPQTGTVSASQIHILKLTKEEFWYNFTNGSDEHEFHFAPN